ncbi:hypothetical protein KIN20_008002 [Parelaphostrongylus tenuis]|uniref:Beta-glucosidase n=1 Tax=Parelaphostrongylus tenuis TaxID=148309 RepID=A0AAD5M683_PARTN|nr:hypothetical protein KIN20_008002 [Parelaphostrongylus tenuis]
MIIVIVFHFAKAKCVTKRQPQYHYFPSGFKWSVATSAFQIEGATKEDGRGPSIWDEYQRKPGKIVDNSTADISSDSYHKFREDIALIKSLGVSHYRFSLSWSRIFPTGIITKPNLKGIHYYHAVIDTLIENNIEPMVTLYHWDLPLALQDAGGWLNREIVKWFRLYAVFCFREYGDKVKLWATLNEPFVQAIDGYCGVKEEMAPGGFQEHCHWTQYLAGHHMQLAHAHAYRAYHGFFTNMKGKIGIINSVNWIEPASESENEFAVEIRQWTIDRSIHPLFEGEYPPTIRKIIDQNSKAEGRTESRLPNFSTYEQDMLIGSFDFLGLNYYTTHFVHRFRQGEKDVRKAIGYDIDGISHQSNRDMPVGDRNSWLRSHPAGLRAVLNHIRSQYGNPEVFITENGCMDTPGESLNDVTRMRYLREHIAAVSQAIVDGCNIVGYTLWSLIDNFEWSAGYTNLFGIHKVDFTSPSRTRTPKRSAMLYADIIRNNSVALIEDCLWDN